MEVHLAPELRAKIDQWMSETARCVDEPVQDATAHYMVELAEARGMLDSRT